MSAGDLDSYCELQSRVDTVDALGQPSTTWALDRMVYADIRYLNGLSAIKAGADTSISKVSIRVRHGAFNAGQRLVFGDEVFNIETVIPIGRKQYVDLVCESINADV